MSCSSIFAYGTLKKEQLRGSMWPRRPLRIEPAIAQGQLWDLGSYPGLTPGDDRILGELWTFAHCDIEPTLETLDSIEGYDATTDSGLYLRRIIEIELYREHKQTNSTIECYSYLIPDIRRWTGARRIEPWLVFNSSSKLAAWPDAQSRVPRSLEDEGDM